MGPSHEQQAHFSIHKKGCPQVPLLSRAGGLLEAAMGRQRSCFSNQSPLLINFPTGHWPPGTA